MCDKNIICFYILVQEPDNVTNHDSNTMDIWAFDDTERKKRRNDKNTEVGDVRILNTACVLLKPDLNPTEAKRTNC